MDQNLTQKAITEALSGSWDDAITTNEIILKSTPDDVDAINRLAKAYAEKGDLKKAIKTSKRVLTIDPFNKIALKCQTKWKECKSSTNPTCPCSTMASIFIEEPGKTKMITLLNLGSESLIASLDAGDEVIINPQGLSVSILTQDGKYIGRLPDNIGARMKNLIKGGNSYQAVVKSLDPKEVKIFIREISSTYDQKNIPSFPPDKTDFLLITN
jgi:tetratricopeptide (TPR) repeat protein